MTQLHALKNSFATLKRDARSDNDVVVWLKQHPQLVPHLPPALYDAVEVRNHAVRNKPSLEDGTLVRHLFIACFVSEAPVKQMTLLDQITGGKTIANPPQHLFYTTYQMTMDAKEWPYVCAEQGFSILRGSAEDIAAKAALMPEVWRTMSPQLSWEKTQDLFATGLIPTTREGFVMWAMTLQTPGIDATELPKDLNFY